VGVCQILKVKVIRDYLYKLSSPFAQSWAQWTSSYALPVFEGGRRSGNWPTSNHKLALGFLSLFFVGDIRCGGNDLRLGFYAERNRLCGDTMSILWGNEGHNCLCSVEERKDLRKKWVERRQKTREDRRREKRNRKERKRNRQGCENIFVACASFH